MNEPAVFGPTSAEGTFPKNLIHKTSNGIEHEDREVHNLYGLLNAAATYFGLINRTAGKYRPFLLTRSFFSGVQKFAWTWSGDNSARWVDLRVSIASLIVSGLGGVPFTGTDVGGFFGNSTEELLIRWYQTGAWCYPFFREHADFNSAFREPYLFRKKDIIRSVIQDRYKLLPFWYTAIRNANLTGEPVVQPLWMEFPNVSEFHTIESEVIVGNSILVVPIVTPKPLEVFVMKPPGKWYDFFNGRELVKSGNVSVSLSEIPVFIRGGKIVPMYTKTAMSTKEILATPITLLIALDERGKAFGNLYLDDGETNLFMEGEYLQKSFAFENGILTSKTFGKKVPEVIAQMRIDRVIVYGDRKIVWKANVKIADEFTIGPEWEVEEIMEKKNWRINWIIGGGGVVVVVVIGVYRIVFVRRKNRNNNKVE
jgi:alpha-glucosidase (family GH31 glycosyl hydrolase)